MASPPSHVQALLPDRTCLKLSSVEPQADGRVLIVAAAIGSVACCPVQRHSRQIHVLVTDEIEEYSTMVATLKCYRPDMQILLIGIRMDGTISNVVHPESAVARIRELLKPIKGYKARQNAHPPVGSPVAQQ